MTDSTTDFAEWIGRREVTEDDLGLAPALAADPFSEICCRVGHAMILSALLET